ncbi:hypothetical protein, partial [Vibrio vulnificus]|uniref:hypothetical protein n=1 Tax=Vibrio vulnificus TaxID=672 RepID=UPI0019D4DB42
SSISRRLPITDFIPHLTLLPTHFSLTVNSPATSPEPVDKSPDELLESSALSIEERPELVDCISESTRSSGSSSGD